jgi:orotidine-5'-phosphate decarboxylase
VVPHRPGARPRAAPDPPEQSGLGATPFADRLAALTSERRSQVCLGLDPDPATLAADAGDSGDPAERAADAVVAHCRSLIASAGPSCVAAKPQLACFERLGAPGWRALVEVIEAARDAGLLVVADGKRGDVPSTAAAYAQALVGQTETPWGAVPGLGADAFTTNPLLGADALEPLIDAASEAGAGVFALVRTSNPGAADLQDASVNGRPLHEHLAVLVAERAPRLAGEDGLSGMGAVVGATAPEHLGRLRELMPDSIFLVPGVGAQGGRPEELGPALAPGRPASLLVAAARSIAGADDPGEAAEELRSTLWGLTV